MEKTMKQTIDFYKVIQERRSVRYYDPEWKIPRQEIKDMLAEAVLAPSSNNLQPWRFLVIDDQELKEKLLPIARNQQQVVDASAIIAVLGDMESYKEAGRIFQKSVDAGFMTEEVKNAFVSNITKSYSNRDSEVIKDIALIDAGLVSMQFMLVAKARGYDTVPMGGYDKLKFKEAFGIPERYLPIMLIAIGKASEPGHPTTRLSVDEVTFWNGLPEMD
ncbi:nitroreductase family protein [Neobacillus niacini]|uniref:nitroreductase family protein n=1 Tax=Neobacillus niacini TaxID=86668 RepID=UPI00285ECA53|nr:nitroreductase family protein [Neobacillus niacini]MDR7001381.1 nitroreductase [Neobacillus niacini]